MKHHHVSATLSGFTFTAVLAAGVGIVLHALGRVEICPYAFGTAIASMAMMLLIVIVELARIEFSAAEK